MPRSSFDDVLIRPRPTDIASRREVNLSRKFYFPCGTTWKGIPIVAANVDGIGTFKTAEVLRKYGMLTAITKFENVTRWERWVGPDLIYTFGPQYAKGVLNEFKSWVLPCNPPAILMLDAANGYTKEFLSVVRMAREMFPDLPLCAGSVATAEGAEAIAKAGADIVKVGIGSGSPCSTWETTGVGMPQLAAILECDPAVRQYGAFIMSEGGCRSFGDIAKAFVAGADFVMNAKLFAGHKETCDVYYGSASTQAQEKHHGGVADYRSIEGKKVEVEHRGNLDDTVMRMLGALRSTGSYINARQIRDFNTGEFVYV